MKWAANGITLVVDEFRPQSFHRYEAKERNFMARFVIHGSILTNLRDAIFANLTRSTLTNLRAAMLTSLAVSILRKILVFAACVLAFAGAQTAVAQAPRGGGHVGGAGRVGGGVPMNAPPRAPISQPRVLQGPRVGEPGHFAARGGFRFGQAPVQVFRRRVFLNRPFFRFGVGLGFNSLWWPTCGPSLGWAWGGGFDCNPVPYYGYGFENYVTMPTYENTVYVYGGDDRDLVWLYLKDGTVHRVGDYWFVNGQVHFSMVQEDPTKPAEHVIPYDELDVQKTIYVNTHRGFRIVFRDEPWQQYLKDHPDLTPTDVPPPQKN
jgi:hypothetical protein